MKLLIAYGSLGKLFHLEEFSKELEKQNVTVKLIKDTDCEEWVFGGSNKVGWGPISLAYVCKKYNKT